MDTTTKKEEVVLALKKSLLPDFQGFKALNGSSELVDALQNKEVTAYIPRSKAEKDESHKQLIPYAAIMTNTHIFMYDRDVSGGEERLHGQTSIGVGGHVNTDDDPSEPFFTFSNGALREIREEVGLELTHTELNDSIFGLLNEDSTDVGKVHLGVAICIRIDDSKRDAVIEACESTMSNPRFEPIVELENPDVFKTLELWSKFFTQGYIEKSSENGKWTDPGFRERLTMLSVTASNLASAASGMVMEDTPRSHMLARERVERGAGEVQCMLAGLCANLDISQEVVKSEAQAFQRDLHKVLRHQSREEDASS